MTEIQEGSKVARVLVVVDLCYWCDGTGEYAEWYCFECGGTGMAFDGADSEEDE